MPNYTKAVVYKLCCRNVKISDIYVGSSCNFTKRKWDHKSKCNNENSKDHHSYVYEFIRQNGGFENWDMIIVEKYPTTDKSNLHTRERHWIETLQSTLNKQIPTQTKKEHYVKNIDKIKKTQKEYCLKNIDKIKKTKKEHYVKNIDKIKEKITCECGSIVNKNNLSRHKKTKKHTDIIVKK
jgi:hypothetical protein